MTYPDSGANSQNPPGVPEAEQEFYERRKEAVHHGAQQLAVAATDAFENARNTGARCVGVGGEELIGTADAFGGADVEPVGAQFLGTKKPRKTGVFQCAEGDLNPHPLSRTSTSS